MEEKSNHKALKTAAVLVVALFLIMHLYKAFYNPITTGSVINYTTNNGIDIKVTAIRDEKVLTTSDGGVISYNVTDGEKVKSGGKVASMYASSEDADNNTEIEKLESTIKDLEEVNGYNSTEAIDIDVLDGKIEDTLLAFNEDVKKGIISGSQNSGELLKLINRRQIATGVSDGFSSLIKSYKSELETLKAKKASATSSVKTKTAGYFSSAVDGYENVLKSSGISEITPETLSKLKPENKEYSSKIIGKIVSDYEWYLAATISLDDSLKLKKGESFTLLTNYESVPKLPVTVKSINKGKQGNSAVVIFSCTYMNSDLATMRQKEMTVVLETYSGLQVNSKAIRFVKGKKGVYVVSGSVLSFVPVNVLYSTDNYCICEAQTTGVRLKLYDEVIIKGKNLYDGKVIG